MNRLRHLSCPPFQQLPEELNFNRPADVLEHARGMLSRSLATPRDLEAWLVERREFEDGVAQALLLARLEFGDQPAELHRKAWLEDLRRDLGTPLEELMHRLDLACLASPSLTLLPAVRRDEVSGRLAARMAMFRETNLALKERLQELENEYILHIGSITVPWAGRPAGVAELRHCLQGDDPIIRRQAWRVRAQALAGLRPVLEDLVDELLAVREQIARNADCETWLEYRAALGHPVRLMPTVVPFPAAGIMDPWDVVCPVEPRLNGRFNDIGPALDELAELLAYQEPSISQTLRHMRHTGLLDMAPHPGKFPLEACFWFPASGQPFLRMSTLHVSDDICHILRHLCTARRALRRTAAGRPPADTYLAWNVEDLHLARILTGILLQEWDPGSARHLEKRLAALQDLERRESLCLERWSTWAHRQPGAGREERGRAWLAALRECWPTLCSGQDETLVDTLFLQGAFFLPDWSPASPAGMLSQA